MKIAILIVLWLMAVVIGLAPIARASPFQPHDLNVSIEEAGEKEFGKGTRVHGWKAEFGSVKDFISAKPGNHGKTALLGTEGTFNVTGGSPVAVNGRDPVTSVPIPGALLLFGVGFASLALWRHRSLRG